MSPFEEFRENSETENCRKDGEGDSCHCSCDPFEQVPSGAYLRMGAGELAAAALGAYFRRSRVLMEAATDFQVVTPSAEMAETRVSRSHSSAFVTKFHGIGAMRCSLVSPFGRF